MAQETNPKEAKPIVGSAADSSLLDKADKILKAAETPIEPELTSKKDEKKFDLPEGFDIKKTPEFKTMRDQLLSQMATINEDVKTKGTELEKIKADVQAQKDTEEKAKLDKLPEIEKLNAVISKQQDQIGEILKQNKEREKALQEQDSKMKRDAALRQSELAPELYDYIHSTDPIQMQQDIDRLMEKVGEAARKKVAEVSPALSDVQTVGSKVTGPVANEGTPGVPTKPAPNFEELKKNVTDVRQLESFFNEYPDYRDIITKG